MMTHCVLFWTRPDLSAEERLDFEAGLRTLLDIPLVSRGSVGTPANTSRSVVDGSYAFALLLEFPNLAAHDAYQGHPVHDKFHARCEGYWNKVLVYDFEDSRHAT